MEKEITLYGSNSCIYCSRAKEWLEKHKLKFIYKDIADETNRKEFEGYNIFGVPLAVVVNKETNDKTTVNGFSPDIYEKEFL